MECAPASCRKGFNGEKDALCDNLVSTASCLAAGPALCMTSEGQDSRVNTRDAFRGMHVAWQQPLCTCHLFVCSRGPTMGMSYAFWLAEAHLVHPIGVP